MGSYAHHVGQSSPLERRTPGLGAEGVCYQSRGGSDAEHRKLCHALRPVCVCERRCDASAAATDMRVLLLLLGGLCTDGDAGVSRNVDLVAGWSAAA